MFLNFIRKEGISLLMPTTAAILFSMPIRFIGPSFTKGEEAAVARDTFAASMCLHPGFAKPQDRFLPMFGQGLRGWLKAIPPGAQMPLPLDFICWAALSALTSGNLEICLASLLILGSHGVNVITPSKTTPTKVKAMKEALLVKAVQSDLVMEASSALRVQQLQPQSRRLFQAFWSRYLSTSRPH